MKRIGIDVSVLATENKTGIGVYCFNLIDHILRIDKKDKFILFAITPLDSSNKDINYFKRYPNVEIKIIRLPIQIFRRMFLLWQKINWPPIEYFTGKVDIFHSFNFFIPPQGSGKSIATFYDLSSIAFPQFHLLQTTQMDKVRFKRMVKIVDLITTISESSKNDFLKKWPDKKIAVVYPASGLTNKEILKGDGLDPGYILFVGTLEPRKNVVNLIKGFLKSNINRKLVLAGGDGWKSDGIFELIDQNPGRIISLGFVPDKELVAIYKNAVCLLYPSFYEGFGIPILEAFSLGVPVITAKNSSLLEIVKDAAIFVDPLDVLKIAQGIRKVIEDGKLRKKMIKRGFEISKRFSWEISAKKMIKIYYSLMD